MCLSWICLFHLCWIFWYKLVHSGFVTFLALLEHVFFIPVFSWSVCLVVYQSYSQRTSFWFHGFSQFAFYFIHFFSHHFYFLSFTILNFIWSYFSSLLVGILRSLVWYFYIFKHRYLLVHIFSQCCVLTISVFSFLFGSKYIISLKFPLWPTGVFEMSCLVAKYLEILQISLCSWS